MATYVLQVNGATVDIAADRIRLESLRVSFRGEPRQLVLSQARTHYSPTIPHGARVTLDRDGVRIFDGWVVSRDEIGEPARERIQYHAADAMYRAREVQVIHPQKKIPRIVANVPQRDDDYDPSWADMTAGQLIDQLIATHAKQLQRLGISTTTSGTSWLSWVPHNVTWQDTDIVAAIEDLLRDQDGVFWWYDPDAGGAWKFLTVEAITTATTFTLASDDVIQDTVRETTEGVWTAVRIIGRPQQETVMLRLSDGTLEKDWDTSLESSWTWDDSYIGAQDDSGTPSSWDGNSVTDTSKSWSTDRWKGGTIVLYDDGAGVSQTRNVQSNTADTINFAPSISLSQVDRYWVRTAGAGDSGSPSSTTQTSLVDTTKSWIADQWKGGTVRLVDTANKDAVVRRIAGNTATQISWSIPHGLANVDSYELWAPGRDEKQYVWRRFRAANSARRTLANVGEEPIQLPASAGIGALRYGDTRRPVLITVFRGKTGLNGYLPVPCYIDVLDGRIYAAYPVVSLTSDQVSLITPGAAQAPDDVILIAPSFTDPIMSVYPPGGKPTSSTSTTVTISGANWTTDEWAGMLIDVWNDAGDVHEATVQSNTSDTITFSPAHSLAGTIVDFQVYGGTGATSGGIRRIYTLHVPDYRGPGLRAIMDDAAKLMAKSRWDLMRHITLPLATWWWTSDPTLVRLAAAGDTTGLENADVPLQEVQYEWTGEYVESTTVLASTDTRAWNGLGDWMAWVRTLPLVVVLSIGNEYVPVRRRPVDIVTGVEAMQLRRT